MLEAPERWLDKIGFSKRLQQMDWKWVKNEEIWIIFQIGLWNKEDRITVVLRFIVLLIFQITIILILQIRKQAWESQVTWKGQPSFLISFTLSLKVFLHTRKYFKIYLCFCSTVIINFASFTRTEAACCTPFLVAQN